MTTGIEASPMAPHDLEIIVLGSAAGGGSPQWNCRCDVCEAVRHTSIPSRTQASIAVRAFTEGPGGWVVLGASPDIRTQIEHSPPLWPAPLSASLRRHSPIDAVVLTNGDIDSIAGLLTLREGQSFSLYATPRILQTLKNSPVFDVLRDDLVQRRPVELERTSLDDARGNPLGLVIEPFLVPGKVPLFEEEAGVERDIGKLSETTIGLRISSGDAHFFYIPSCAQMTPELAQKLRGAPLVFFDGTLFHDEELIEKELATKTGRRMGHMSISGAEGSIKAFEDLDVRRKVFIHINNSNPILLPDSEERRAVEVAQWEIAHDGMEVTL